MTLIALVTGLSLGLKRGGYDIVQVSKIEKKAEKLKPGRDVIPWTDIQEASGKSLIFVGDHIYLVIGGTLIYLYTIERKHK